MFWNSDYSTNIYMTGHVTRGQVYRANKTDKILAFIGMSVYIFFFVLNMSSYNFVTPPQKLLYFLGTKLNLEL